jgi:putative transposase
MARALSNDLRERVVARHEAGESIRAVAAVFDLAPSTVSKWAQRRRETGSVAPKKIGGHRRPLLEPHRTWIEARLQQTPELTLEGLRAELAGRGIRVSYGAVQKFVKDIGLSFKKNRLRQRAGPA